MIKRYLILIIYLLFQMTYLQTGNLDTTNDLWAGVSRGVLYLPNENDVKNGVNYGASGTEFTGFYTGSGTTNNIIYTNTDFLVQRSGQITSYRAEDDAIYRKRFTGGYTTADESGDEDENARFTNHGNGTVTDNFTDLMWTMDADQGEGEQTWYWAMQNADECSAGGYYDWRLPNSKELESLVDYNNPDPSLPKGHPFTNFQDDVYWTSTAYEPDSTYAWVVDFDGGYVDFYVKDELHYVWYVHDEE